MTADSQLHGPLGMLCSQDLVKLYPLQWQGIIGLLRLTVWQHQSPLHSSAMFVSDGGYRRRDWSYRSPKYPLHFFLCIDVFAGVHIYRT